MLFGQGYWCGIECVQGEYFGYVGVFGVVYDYYVFVFWLFDVGGSDVEFEIGDWVQGGQGVKIDSYGNVFFY